MLNRTINRIILIVSCLFIFFIVGIFLMQENQKAQLQIYSQESTKRTEILLKKNLELLSQNQISYTFDYTFWDDMVRFVNEPDSVWAKRNIISSIQTYKLNCAWVFNSTFKPIFFHNNDYDEKDIKQFFLEPETVKKIFSKGKFPHFFLKTEKYLLEIACAPIQYSNDLQREGTAQGYYITGRIWDDEYLNEIHKINNSKVFLAFPGIYSEVQTNETNIDQPEIILAKTPLLDYSGNVISYLISRHVDKGIYGLLKENQKQLPLFLIYGVVFLFTITLSLIFWVVKPLKIISIGLVSGETEKIRNLSTHKTEFGNFASLLIKFFRQKNILETEITVREKIEIELLEVKKNLEVQVENRTLKLTELNKKLIGEQKQTKMYFDSSGSIICLLDKNGNIKLVNRYGCNLLYYTESEVIGKNCFRDLLTKSSAKELYPVFKNYLSEKPAHIKPYIAYVLTKHNQVKIILINNFYNKINDDGTTELLFSAIDVTDLKKAEKELKDKEQRYRLLVETQVDPICRWLLDTTITFVNKSFCAFFGKQQLELLGSRWIDLISKDYHNKVIAKHENVTKEVSVIEYEVEVFKPDGTKHWMLWTDTPLRDNRGVITEYQSIARDISKSKAAEINLRKLSSAVVQSPVSIVITDVSGNIEYVNPKFTQVTGYTLAEVKGQNPRILKSGDQGKEFYKDLWDTILEGKIWKGEFRNKKKNGDLFWESGHISPITDEKGSVTHFIAVKEDITEKKKMLSELISSKESAERSNKLKDAFIANISHEIRTPLNGILGMTNIIKEMLSPHIGKDDEIFFEGIEISSKRIIRTIDMIINYSRVLVGEFKTEQKNNNLDQICRNLIKEYGYLASAKSLELIYENKYGMANIFGDEYAITQSISNLMENAIKFTQEGFVKITLYKDENGDIKLDISDTGIGIKNEYIQYIFEPYRQEEMGYGRKYEGVGLGLALVKKLINLNNFSISVSSLKGAGSTFTINFGSSTTAFKNLEDVYKPIISHQDQKKSKDYLVLIVEDDPINQLLIKNFIMKEYKVLITDTSDNVIEILEQNNVDLILMDISIKGGKNGLELAKEIKMIPKFSNIPIIATTAHVFSNDRQNAIEYKCDDFLPKPFTRKGLLDTIHKFVKVESIGNYKIEVS